MYISIYARQIFIQLSATDEVMPY